jgi:hypothetical protein
MKFLATLLLLFSACAIWAQARPLSPVGEWEGESVCQVPKPCTTEHVIYEIKQSAQGQMTIKADKVVTGQRQWMGDIRCQWSASEQNLTCPMEGRTPGIWEFKIGRNEMTGTLVIREGNVLFRKIAVKRKS